MSIAIPSCMEAFGAPLWLNTPPLLLMGGLLVATTDADLLPVNA